MENTEPTTSVTQPKQLEERRYYVAGNVKKRGYQPHPLDRLVHSRMKMVRFKNEDGTVTKARIEVPYKTPRPERYVPFVNTGKIYPFGSKRQGF